MRRRLIRGLGGVSTGITSSWPSESLRLDLEFAWCPTRARHDKARHSQSRGIPPFTMMTALRSGSRTLHQRRRPVAVHRAA